MLFVVICILTGRFMFRLEEAYYNLPLTAFRHLSVFFPDFKPKGNSYSATGYHETSSSRNVLSSHKCKDYILAEASPSDIHAAQSSKTITSILRFFPDPLTTLSSKSSRLMRTLFSERTGSCFVGVSSGLSPWVVLASVQICLFEHSPGRS